MHTNVLTGCDRNKVLNCFTLEVVEIITTKYSECFGKLVLNVKMVPPNLSQSKKRSWRRESELTIKNLILAPLTSATFSPFWRERTIHKGTIQTHLIKFWVRFRQLENGKRKALSMRFYFYHRQCLLFFTDKKTMLNHGNHQVIGDVICSSRSLLPFSFYILLENSKTEFWASPTSRRNGQNISKLPYISNLAYIAYQI